MANTDIERYLKASVRENTSRSYRSAIDHFELTWGGLLPATPEGIARYLAEYAGKLSISTLEHRLVVLGRWHKNQGFPDPTRTLLIKSLMKGIRELHPHKEKRATPLLIEDLSRLCEWVDGSDQVSHKRDKALLLIGFWRAFRSDELVRIQAENVHFTREGGMTIYLPRSKTDRSGEGREFSVPALKKFCPVSAYKDWLTLSGIAQGPAFRAIDQWGNISDTALNINSVIPLIRNLFKAAGIEGADSYTAHSLKRGFATWAGQNGWDIKSLMEYVGWRDVKSAIRYVDVEKDVQKRIESSLR